MTDYTTQSPTNGMPVVGRPIINANINVSNRIESADINSVMMNTFNDIAKVLSDHCGPYGQFAMIVNPLNRVAEPVFTKDGIGIVRAIEYMSVMQEYVRDTLAYMGSRIETAAGDGTTSSMIICATALKSFINSIRQKSIPILGKGNEVFSYHELMHTYRRFVAATIKVLNTYGKHPDKVLSSLNAKDRRECIWRIAYSQAYTSSHGNAELSRAVAQLFADTPEAAWDYLYIDKCKYESEQLYQVAVDDSQYTIENVMIWPSGTLTENMGTARIRQNTPVIIAGICPSAESTYFDGNQLFNEIKTAIADPSAPELTVICPKDIDQTTLQMLQVEFKEHPNNNVVLFMVDYSDPRLNDIVCIKTLANDLQPVSKLTCSYKYEFGDLKIIDGLYEKTESKLNPNCGKQESLDTILRNLDLIIKQIKSQVASKALNSDIAKLQKLRLKLMVSKRTYFLIGGSAYDSAAAVDIVLDAILAVKHSLKQGFCLGGNKTLYAVLKDGYNDIIQQAGDLTNKEREMFKMFSSMFVEGIIAVHDANVKWFTEDENRPEFDYKNSFDLVKYASALYDKTPTQTAVDESWRVSVDVLFDQTNYNQTWENSVDINAPIIQPITADQELLKRFGELGIKFARTVRIISPGGLVSKDNSEVN